MLLLLVQNLGFAWGAQEAAEPEVAAGGHYWPTPKRKRRKDPLEERLEKAREDAAELRTQLERAIRGEPVEVEPVAEIAQEPEASREAPRPVVRLTDTRRLESIRADLARTERAIERYEAVVEAKAAVLSAHIETLGTSALSEIESELTREAARLHRLLTKRLLH